MSAREKSDETLVSPEEHDQLVRSNKKFKRKITNWIFEHDPEKDAHMEDVQMDNPQVVHARPTGSAPHPPSFKDMLNHKNFAATTLQSGFPDLEEDEVSDDDLPPDDFEGTIRCPVILLSKEEKLKLRKPWKQSLIIKMFNGKVGYMGLMRKLKRKWSLKGDMILTDIGCKYYIARFTNNEDYHHVLTQGPWMIDDNYLTIRKWTPNFIADDAPIKVLTAWVRIPSLSVEYFDSDFLHKVGSKIGKVLRIDKTTAQAERGQFTRLSIEIDLTKPLLSKFWLKGRIWKIQYEGLHSICFSCGCWGHSSKECPNLQPVASPHIDQMEQDQMEAAERGNHVSRATTIEQENYGEWMMVRKPGRRRISRGEKPPAGETKPEEPSRVQTPARLDSPPVQILNSQLPGIQENQGQGSRFSVLGPDLQEPP